MCWPTITWTSTLEKGEIHALLGENGAGKSTLMNILYGLYQPDEGEIRVNGQPVQHHHARTMRLPSGIGMVHQHFMLVPPLTVTENIMLGQESLVGATQGAWAASRCSIGAASAARIRELSQQYGLEVDPDAYVRDLTVGAQQRVEIVKALYRAADILILDEPTAVLTPQEADELFVIMRGLVEQGKSIVFITHKLREVFAVADRISVMRGGQMVGSVKPAEATSRDAGRDDGGPQSDPADRQSRGAPGRRRCCSVEDLRVVDDRQHMAVDGVSLEVRAGEILGVAGVQGNGQTELAEALTGLRTAVGGKVTMLGDDTTHATPRQLVEAGMAHVPEDRHKHGLVLSFPVRDNLVLCTYYRSPFANGIELDYPVIEQQAERVGAHVRRAHAQHHDQRRLAVRRQPAERSSWRASWIAARSSCSIASQPTRGLDVGSIEFIHRPHRGGAR